MNHGGEDGSVCCHPTNLDCFVAGGGPLLLWGLVGEAMVLPLPPGAQGGRGARGHRGAKADCGSTILSVGKRLDKSGQGEEEYTVMSQWQFCRAG
jgi:hypothetical protein